MVPLKVCRPLHYRHLAWVTVVGMSCTLQVFSSIPSLEPPNARSTPPLNHDSQKCLQTQLNAPRGKITPTHRPLKPTAVNEREAEIHRYDWLFQGLILVRFKFSEFFVNILRHKTVKCRIITLEKKNLQNYLLLKDISSPQETMFTFSQTCGLLGSKVGIITVSQGCQMELMDIRS